MKINVGSENPVKIDAVREAFRLFFNNFNIYGVETRSTVESQPKNLEETAKGAKNRAINCFGNCDYSVGLESGIFSLNNLVYIDICCCSIYDGERITNGLSPGFESPQFAVRRVFKENLELGDIFDQVVKEKNTKQRQGIIGILTGNKYLRGELLKQGVIMALLPIINKKLYDLK